MALKVIQTEYKGYRFRSRLEARWAVFFDRLGMPFLYEPEGFDLNGHWYLPDFKCGVAEGCWVEIKPIGLSDKEDQLLCALSGETQSSVLALIGQPWPKKHEVQAYRNGRQVRRGTAWRLLWSLIYTSWYSDQLLALCAYGFKRTMAGNWPVIQAAYKAARQARFEHGEKP